MCISVELSREEVNAMKKIRDNIIRKVPWLCYLNGLIYLKKIKSINKSLSNIDFAEKTLEVQNAKDYKKTVRRFCMAEPRCSDVAIEFYLANIEVYIEKYSRNEIEKDEPILICVIKDDIKRVKEFVEHYRKLGIKYFAFVDNDSSDGTREYLCEQPDVNVYLVRDMYTTFRREAWVNRLCAYFGYNHWFVCVDSDELLYFNNCENNSLKELIKKKHSKRILALLIDMYPKIDILNQNIFSSETFANYVFYDKDTYYKVSNYRMEALYGGPRKRIFSAVDSKFNCRLTKYPIFYYEEGDFQGCSHYAYPYKYNYTNVVDVVLLHYKFFESDIVKYKERALKGNYSSGSLEYKVYIDRIERKTPLVFYDEQISAEMGMEKKVFVDIDGMRYEEIFKAPL